MHKWYNGSKKKTCWGSRWNLYYHHYLHHQHHCITWAVNTQPKLKTRKFCSSSQSVIIPSFINEMGKPFLPAGRVRAYVDIIYVPTRPYIYMLHIISNSLSSCMPVFSVYNITAQYITSFYEKGISIILSSIHTYFAPP